MRREQDIIVHDVFHPQGIPLLHVPLIPLTAATVSAGPVEGDWRGGATNAHVDDADVIGES